MLLVYGQLGEQIGGGEQQRGERGGIADDERGDNRVERVGAAALGASVGDEGVGVAVRGERGPEARVGKQLGK